MWFFGLTKNTIKTTNSLESISKKLNKNIAIVALVLGLSLSSVAKKAEADLIIHPNNINTVKTGIYLVYEKNNIPILYAEDQVLVFEGKYGYERAEKSAEELNKKSGNVGIKIVIKFDKDKILEECKHQIKDFKEISEDILKDLENKNPIIDKTNSLMKTVNSHKIDKLIQSLTKINDFLTDKLDDKSVSREMFKLYYDEIGNPVKSNLERIKQETFKRIDLGARFIRICAKIEDIIDS